MDYPTQISITIPSSLREKLENAAREAKKSRANYVKSILLSHFKED